MNSTFDGEMRRVYAPLQRDHERLKAELMASLPETAPISSLEDRRAHRWLWTGISFMKRRVVPISVGVAAAAALLMIVLWPGGQKYTLAIEDVVRQFRDARSIHLHYAINDPDIFGGKPLAYDIYLRMPDKFRQVGTDPNNGHQIAAIVNGKQGVVLDTTAKTFQEMATPVEFSNSFEEMFAMFFKPPVGSQLERSETQSGKTDRWYTAVKDLGFKESGGRRLQLCRLQTVKSDGQPVPDSPESTRAFLWLDPATHQTLMVTCERIVEGKTREVGRVDVQLNPDLPDELFSLAKPAGFTHGNPAIDVLKAYARDRAALKGYRSVSVREIGNNGNPFAAIHDGKNLYAAALDSTSIVATKGSQQIAEPIMAKLRENRREPAQTAFPGMKRMEGNNEFEARYILPELGWPKLPVDPSRVATRSNVSYRLLPPRADRAGLIGIQCRENPVGKEELGHMWVLWVDPGHSHLCMYYEEHHRKGIPWGDEVDWKPSEPETTGRSPGGPEYDKGAQILEIGRTPDGHDYPMAVRHTGASIDNGRRHLWQENVIRVLIESNDSATRPSTTGEPEKR